ncbi:MAG: hypothetical protein FJ293_10060 [Planctomycetes bacterium]|nr:hypothetical protein [Planctomycetota bacterium]
MKKVMPWIRLGVFCFALFGLSALAVLLKQNRLLADAKENLDEQKGAEAASASLVGKAGDGATARPAGGTEAAKRDASLQSGRALFDLPESISIAEASELMNELRRAKQEQDGRKVALDQREKELQTMEREIESRRSEVLTLAEKLQLNAPLDVNATSGDLIAPETLDSMAKIVAGMEAEKAASMLGNMPADKAATILLRMEDKSAAEVLSFVAPDKLLRLTEMLLKARPGDE